MDRREFLSGAISGSAAAAAAKAVSNKGEVIQAQYVIVELMGYKKLCGRMTQGVAGLLQLDIPVEGGFSTQYINPTSIYRITVVDEKTVVATAKHLDPLPTIQLEIPARQTYLEYDRDEDDSQF